MNSSNFKKISVIPMKALRTLFVDGPGPFWHKIKTNLFGYNKRYSVNKLAKEQQVKYHHYYDYLIHATLFPMLEAPYDEEDLYIKEFMDHVRNNKRNKHTQNMPGDLVSVIMPSYNRANCIGTAIESVLAQTYPNWELIIADDGSTDYTEEIVKQYKDKRIQYIPLDQNRGPGYARNRAMEQAMGKYFCYLDSDNAIHQDFITIMLGELIENPSFEAIYCAQRIVDCDGSTGQDETAVRFAPFNRSFLENRNYIDLGVMMHRSSVIKKYGNFNEEMPRFVDWEFILRITQDIHPKALPCILSTYNYKFTNHQVTFTQPLDKAYMGVDRYLKQEPLFKESPYKQDHAEKEMMFSPLSVPVAAYSKPVTIVIPNFECLQYLKMCLAAIEEYTPPGSYEIVIVDNNSSTEVKEHLKQQVNENRLNVIFNPANYGFTHAVNQGIEAASPQHDILLLNNDAVVTKGWLEGLQEVFDYLPEAGLVVPRQVLPAYTKTLKVHCPQAMDYREVDVNISHHHRNLVDPFLNEKLGLMELNFAPFFCVYIPRTTVNEVGLLDLENGPHYRSDRLYCDAVRHLTGKKVIYTPRSKVYHLLQKSTDYLKENNQALYRDMFVNNSWEQIVQAVNKQK